MSEHNKVGKEGEEFAVQYLIKKGYKILEINWRYNHKEIDVITQQGDQMVFVEVKTRTSTTFERPQDAVTVKKMKHLMIAADAYLQIKEINIESRYDIITVLAGDSYKILEHILDAFKPNDLI